MADENLNSNNRTGDSPLVGNTPISEISANNSIYDVIAKGIVDNNSQYDLKIWTGTSAEYDSLQTHPSNMLYVITDNDISINNNNLFDFKWSDHLINDLGWIQSDNFEWFDGTKYTSAYQHLVNDITGQEALTETIAGYTITYYLAPDDHKTVLANMETTVQNIYEATGIAWYYILDTTNQRFKLPRTIFAFVGARNNAGEYVPAGLPNLTGNLEGIPAQTTSTSISYGSGVFESTNSDSTKSCNSSGSNQPQVHITFDASDSNSIYGNSDTVQQPATEMFLYFYVGNTITNTEYIDISALNTEVEHKVNPDMDNLDDEGRNIANWSSNVTNCITEIPQDIKVELNNGTLTLKAGSKVYNGNGLLETISSDVNLVWNYSGTFSYAYCYSLNSIVVASNGTETVSSLPTPATTYKLFYNTTDNKIYYDDNNSAMQECSFPIVICTADNGIKSIDKVFNGIGYIGSTVFVLPGVKGLIPNGRNEDGTCKNIFYETPSVITRTLTGSGTTRLALKNDNSILIGAKYYLGKDNYLRFNSKTGNPTESFVIGNITRTDGVINSIITKQAFISLDYNDSATVSLWSMPSDRYIDLTLNSSGSSYTAPANGYYAIGRVSTASSQYVGLYSSTMNSECISTSSGQNIYTWLPAQVGSTVTCSYTGGSTLYFRFVFAEGEI